MAASDRIAALRRAGLLATLLLGQAAAVACGYDFDRPWSEQPPDGGLDGPVPPPDGLLPPDLGPADLPLPDVPAVAPRFCWKGTETSTAGCDVGWVAVAGGSFCPAGIRASSLETNGTVWRAECADAKVSTDVICTDTPSAFRRFDLTNPGDTVRPACGGNDLPVGGGCNCAAGVLLHHAPALDANEWVCVCSEVGNHHGHVICTDPGTAAAIGRRLEVDQFDQVLTSETAVTLSCGSGAALSGGCGTFSTPLAASYTTRDGWGCLFTAAPGSGFIRNVCVTKPLPDCL